MKQTVVSETDLRNALSFYQACHNWTSVDAPPLEGKSHLVLCKSGYITTGFLDSGTWWVYDDNKHEHHPRRHDDPVTFYCNYYPPRPQQ